MIRTVSCVSVLSLCLVALTTSVQGERADELQHEEQRPLEALLQQVLGKGAQLEVDSAEAELRSVYRTLPKPEHGMLGPEALRYAVAHHMRGRHFMFFEGLEAHDLWATPVLSPWDVRILERAPAPILQALNEHNFTAWGVSLREMALYATVLKRFALQRVMEVLEATFHILQHKSTLKLSSRKVQKTFTVFIGLLSTLKIDETLSGRELAAHIREKWPRLLTRLESNPSLNTRALMEEEMGRISFEDRGISLNPFRSTLPWERVWSISERLVTRFGSWQSKECTGMKHTLGNLDKESWGRVPLGKFYQAEGTGALSAVFTESLDFLRSVSAIDDSVPDSPKVIVANYVYSIANSKNLLGDVGYTCRNDCIDVIDALQQNFSAASAVPEVILELVAGIVPPSSLTQEPLGPVPAKLREKLYRMAEQQGGECILHSRLFMQWLHYAFPLDCPYPQPYWRKTRKERLAFLNSAYSATEPDKLYHISKANAAWHMNSPWLSQWSDEEVSVLQVEREDLRIDTPAAESDRTLQLLLFAVIASLVFSTVRRGSQILRQYKDAKADKMVEELISSDTAAKELPMRKRSSSGASKAGKGGAGNKQTVCAASKSRQASVVHVQDATSEVTCLPSQEDRAGQKEEVRDDAKQGMPIKVSLPSDPQNADDSLHVSQVSLVQNAADSTLSGLQAGSEDSADVSPASEPQDAILKGLPDSKMQGSKENQLEAVLTQQPRTCTADAEDDSPEETPAAGCTPFEKPFAELQPEEQAQVLVQLPSENESNKDFGGSSTSTGASQESGDDATDSLFGVAASTQESFTTRVQEITEKLPGLNLMLEIAPELTSEKPPPGLSYMAETTPEVTEIAQTMMHVPMSFRPPPGLPPPESGNSGPEIPLLYSSTCMEIGNERIEELLACWDAAEAEAEAEAEF